MFLIKAALKEDLADSGDITSSAVFSCEEGKAVLMSKDRGILAGVELFQAVFGEIDRSVLVHLLRKDGERLRPGDTVAEVKGKIGSILQGERTAINFISFLSGIATATGRFVAEAQRGGDSVILDTRKTLPGYRTLAKYAVEAGGGRNHRMGLYDMVMIKDNHIDGAGSLTEAVRKVRERYGSKFKVEVECRNLPEVHEAMGLDVDIIMLDNMGTPAIEEAVGMRRERGDKTPLFEVSGNVVLDRVAEVSAAGVDFISVGSLTHSVKGFDFSLKMET